MRRFDTAPEPPPPLDIRAVIAFGMGITTKDTPHLHGETCPTCHERWPMFGTFLRDYRELREQYLSRRGRPSEPFAERLHQASLRQPRADVEQLGRDLMSAKYRSNGNA